MQSSGIFPFCSNFLMPRAVWQIGEAAGMKRIMTFTLAVLCLSAFSAQGMEARYHAQAAIDFHPRESAKAGGRRIARIKEGSEAHASERPWHRLPDTPGTSQAPAISLP